MLRWERTDCERHYSVPVFRWIATLGAEHGSSELVHPCTSALAGIAARSGGEAVAALARALGEVAMLEGDAAVPEAQFEQPLAVATELGLPLERAEIERRAATALAHAGRGARAVELLVSAHRTASRQMSREIASNLSLSPRTVEMHVDNVLVKLDCRSRVDTARRAGAIWAFSPELGRRARGARNGHRCRRPVRTGGGEAGGVRHSRGPIPLQQGGLCTANANDLDQVLEPAKVIWIGRIERKVECQRRGRNEEIQCSAASRLAAGAGHGCVDPAVGSGCVSVKRNRLKGDLQSLEPVLPSGPLIKVGSSVRSRRELSERDC